MEKALRQVESPCPRPADVVSPASSQTPRRHEQRALVPAQPPREKAQVQARPRPGRTPPHGNGTLFLRQQDNGLSLPACGIPHFLFLHAGRFFFRRADDVFPSAQRRLSLPESSRTPPAFPVHTKRRRQKRDSRRKGPFRKRRACRICGSGTDACCACCPWHARHCARVPLRRCRRKRLRAARR